MSALENKQLQTTTIIKRWSKSYFTFFRGFANSASPHFCVRAERSGAAQWAVYAILFLLLLLFLAHDQARTMDSSVHIRVRHKEHGGRSILGCPHWLFQVWGLLSPDLFPFHPKQTSQTHPPLRQSRKPSTRSSRTEYRQHTAYVLATDCPGFLQGEGMKQPCVQGWSYAAPRKSAQHLS